MKERPHRVAGHVERRRTRHLRFQSRTLSRHRLSAPCHENNHLIGAQARLFSEHDAPREPLLPGICTGTGKKTPGGAGSHTVPVKRHRGEPGHTRDRHKNLTNQPQNQPHPPTHAPDHTRTPGHTRRPTPHHSPASAVVVTVMATAPGRGSSEGASPTASVTALLRVPGGAEVSGFGIRERLIALTVHARRQGPGMITRDAPLAKQKTEGLMA